MKEKMWFLFFDSVMQANHGAWEIMDNARDISLKCFCELGNYDYNRIREETIKIEKDALNAIDCKIERQNIMIQLIELNLTKLKRRIDDGEFNRN